MTLQEVLLDDGRPFCSHYGAVVGLTELGPEVKSDCLHCSFVFSLVIVESDHQIPEAPSIFHVENAGSL